MTRLTRFVLRRRRWVVMIWLAVLLAGGAAAGRVGDRLDRTFTLPGQPGYEASLKILRSYGISTQQPPILLVLSAPPGRTLPAGDADRALAAVARAVPTVRVTGYPQTRDDVFRTRDGRTEFAFAFRQRPTADGADLERLREALRASAPPDVATGISGLPALQAGGSATGPGVLAETLVGGVGALAVLAFVFASVLALVPLLVAAVSVLATFAILLGLTYLGGVSFVVEFLVALVGLGVAIDYSLLIVTRWREERARGTRNEDAVVTAMATAGRAVVFSGLTVAVSLLALVVLPVPFLRSIGLGGALIPLVSVAVVTTLLPAVLGGAGPRLDWPRVRSRDGGSRFWQAWARLVVRHRAVSVAAGVIVLGALIVPLASIEIGQARADSLAHDGPAYAGRQALRTGGVPDGVLTPLTVLATRDAATSVASRVRQVPGVATAFVPDGTARQGRDTALVVAVPDVETSGGASLDVVRAVRSALDGDPGVLGIAGNGPNQLDYRTGVIDRFPAALLLIVVVTYVLLVRSFRSLLLPAKAVLLNLASVAATYGAMVFFWQQGHGSQALYGVAPTGAISFWVPQMVFAFLFGLSMDYEVFILARVREEYDVSGSTDGAVVTALARTGRLVTSAALILFLAFLSLSSSPQTELKVFATGLGFGILLDATVVRMLLVPVLVSLFGRWNWYLPRSVARLLRIRTPHAAPRAVPVTAPVTLPVTVPGRSEPAVAAEAPVHRRADREHQGQGHRVPPV